LPARANAVSSVLFFVVVPCVKANTAMSAAASSLDASGVGWSR
jgi:hypothetical protein